MCFGRLPVNVHGGGQVFGHAECRSVSTRVKVRGVEVPNRLVRHETVLEMPRKHHGKGSVRMGGHDCGGSCCAMGVRRDD